LGVIAMTDRNGGKRDGRPGRAARNTLSRARIVDAAVALIDTEGLSGLTMPRLADQLGVGTMSLYRHVEDKEDLLHAVAAHLISQIQVPAGEPADWETRVVGYLRLLREQALCHPALGRLLADRGLTDGPIFDHLETLHGILRAAGFGDLEAVRAFYSLATYVFGSLMWELPRVHDQPHAAYVAAWDSQLEKLDPSEYPNLMALRDHLVTSASTEQFEFGLRHLVGSLRPVPRVSVPRVPARGVPVGTPEDVDERAGGRPATAMGDHGHRRLVGQHPEGVVEA
jgi:AcrR family transcriptional regulator